MSRDVPRLTPFEFDLIHRAMNGIPTPKGRTVTSALRSLRDKGVIENWLEEITELGARAYAVEKALLQALSNNQRAMLREFKTGPTRPPKRGQSVANWCRTLAVLVRKGLATPDREGVPSEGRPTPLGLDVARRLK